MEEFYQIISKNIPKEYNEDIISDILNFAN